MECRVIVAVYDRLVFKRICNKSRNREKIRASVYGYDILLTMGNSETLRDSVVIITKLGIIFRNLKYEG